MGIGLLRRWFLLGQSGLWLRQASVASDRPTPQPCAAADAVDCLRLSKPSCPARLILFRWASKRIKAGNSKSIVAVITGQQKLDSPSASTQNKAAMLRPYQVARSVETEAFRRHRRCEPSALRRGALRAVPFRGTVAADLRRLGPTRRSTGRRKKARRR